MCPSLRIAAVVLVLSAPDARAQFYVPPGRPKTVVVNIPYGPFGSLSLPATVFHRSPGQWYPPGLIPGWYYPPVIQIPVPIPVPVQQNPTVIVIQTQPPAAAPDPGRPAFNEFGPNPPKVAPKNPGRVIPKVAPPKPDVGIGVPIPPKGDPKADADRAVEAGKKAFAAGQYGRALELFRRSAAQFPNESSFHYYVSQAAFALGKYRDAVTAIANCVAVKPDWAVTRRSSRDLYDKTPEVFDDHLKALRQAVVAFPDDPALLFLLGHQLWFDDKKAEARADARPFLQKALAVGRDLTPAGAFP